MKRRGSLDEERHTGAAHSDCPSAFFLNLTNPTIDLSLLAVLAVQGIEGHNSWWLTFLVISGIFGGSMAWWMLHALIANQFRDRITGGTVRRMNRPGFAPADSDSYSLILSRGGPK